MDHGQGNWSSLIRRALAAQMEMGIDEMVIDQGRMQAALQRLSKQPGHPEARAADDPFQASHGFNSSPEFESLEAHRQAICNCVACPLGATRNKFVYGVGNTNADLMFVGEGPGAEEDRRGEPFVGRAGQLLDKILAAMQLSRDEVYIANVVKCRPPNNRDPLPEEMNTCMPYLREQIRLIKPRILCALGRIAGQALLSTTTPLSKLRGQWHQFEGIPLLVTYHPAALLRFQQYKKPTWEDMQLIMARLRSEK
jgi:DNA polymerase